MVTSKTPTIWASTVPAYPTRKQLASVKLPVDPNMTSADDDPIRVNRKELVNASKMRGEELPVEVFPTQFVEFRPHDPTDLTQPYLLGAFHFVHRELAEVLRRFDLGPAVLVPVKFLESDGKTPLSDDYLILNVGSARETVVPEHSPSIYQWTHYPDEMPAGTPLLAYDQSAQKKEITCRRSAMEGPPLWLDPDVKDVIFLADPIARALDEAGYRRALKIKPCTLAD